jgi:hypothetical protein
MVKFDLGERCKDHPEDVFCHVCISRATDAGDAAKKCLDPTVEAFTEELPLDVSGPEFIALVNHHSQPDKKAFAMRRAQAFKVVSVKPILTTLKEGYQFDYPIVLANYTTKSQVCDAIYIRSFSIKLKDGVSGEAAMRLWGTKLSLDIDEEKIVSDMPLREALQKKEIVLPRPAVPEHSCIFGAHLLDENQNAMGDQWAGFILPNLSRIRVLLDGVRGGSGLVFIETSWNLVRYTTREMKKA